MNEFYECSKCEDTGVMNVPNGDADFDKEWCSCKAGIAAQELSAELDDR